MFLNLMIFSNVPRDLGSQDPVFYRICMSNPLSTDIRLVAGLNDIRQLISSYKGQDGNINAMAESVSEDIMRRIRSLYALTLEHHCRHNVSDTFAVAAILRVPAMYWSELDGELPAPDYTNLKEVVDRTNLRSLPSTSPLAHQQLPRFTRPGLGR